MVILKDSSYQTYLVMVSIRLYPQNQNHLQPTQPALGQKVKLPEWVPEAGRIALKTLSFKKFSL